MAPRGLLITGAILALVVAGAAVLTFSAPREPETASGPAAFRRLNQTQYANSIADIFGAGINIPGRFDPPVRDEGLLAMGDGKAVVSASGLEQSELRARDIAAQVLAEDRRKDVLPCGAEAVDEACARQFVEKYGRLIYRRPLDKDEVAATLSVIKLATEKLGSPYAGLEAGLSRLLASPNFLFRVELTEADSATGRARLNDYALASRISFLLWNSAPDDELLNAAASGALRDKVKVEKQVERLMASPRFEQGVRAFFSDMFGYEQFEGLTKDQTLFPIYTSQLAKDAREQLLLTLVDLLVTNKADYRDLFTTKKTFINRNLGALYDVPVAAEAIPGWTPHTFGAKDPRMGILTLAGFLMLDPSHEARSSPTNRGKFVRELFLCQKVPPPPQNVDFQLVEDVGNKVHKTMRDRLTVHRENPTCAGCHAITDPIGLAMEHYDAIGTFRTTENDVPIDASGTFEGKSYKDAIELQRLLHDSPDAPRCVAQRVYEYGVGRAPTAAELPWLEYLTERFAGDRYSFVSLLRTVATSDAFQAVSAETHASN